MTCFDDINDVGNPCSSCGVSKHPFLFLSLSQSSSFSHTFHSFPYNHLEMTCFDDINDVGNPCSSCGISKQPFLFLSLSQSSSFSHTFHAFPYYTKFKFRQKNHSKRTSTLQEKKILVINMRIIQRKFGIPMSKLRSLRIVLLVKFRCIACVFINIY